MDRLVERGVAAVFFTSGFAALVYQVVWQRALFVLFGVNAESVTVVVTAFMAGLGVGGLLGGRLSRRGAGLHTFATLELGLAAFGAVSLPLFSRVGQMTATLPPAFTALVVGALLVVPTALMGATLPILVARAAVRSGNVGRSIGTLYGYNTIGSACAAAAAVVLLASRGQLATTRIAALCNLFVGLGALLMARWGSR